MKYAVVVEREGKSYGAYIPDLPGCVAVGKSRGRVLKLIREALALHVADMRSQGLPIPRPSTQVETVDFPLSLRKTASV